MPIETGMYQNQVVPQAAPQPSMLDSLSKAYSVAGMANQLRTQQATRDAYSHNVDPSTGQLNQAGFLTELGQANPQAAIQMRSSLAEANKAQADAQSAQMDAQHKILSVTNPAYGYVASIPDSDPAAKQTAFNQTIQSLKDQGVPTDNLTKWYHQNSDGSYQWDPQAFGRQYYTMLKSKEGLDQQLSEANINKTNAESAMNPAKLNSELYGSRSPNAELTSQYDKQAAPVRSSQMAMQQMIDNYKNPSPQGDASLVLNAFKIKFPNAPDVNSLEELKSSQAATDKWRNYAKAAVEGGLDQNTRDNLMRDGVSTFRANVQSLQGIQQRYQARQKAQNVNDPTLTAEPAIDKTYQDAMDMQKQIGPYVPPNKRGGPGLVSKAIDAVTGTKAEASEKPQAGYRKSGSAVSADEVAQYAMKHGMKLSDAQNTLKGMGYAIGR